jgi:hypothetical protein
MKKPDRKRAIVEHIVKRVTDESPFVEKSAYTLAALRRILREELRNGRLKSA